MGFDENKIPGNAHFDYRVSYAQVRDNVEDPAWVARHGFLPLISKTNVEKKFDGTKRKIKEREIAYASHVDKCIYHHYANLLNKRYNEMAGRLGINKASVAYRTDLGKCNIDFALGAFSKMTDLESCYVLVADFKSFFPSLSHAIAKRQLRKVFADDKIPSDYYNVFRSVIHWAQWDEEKLMVANGIDPKRRHADAMFNKLRVALPRKVFKANVATEVDKPWQDTDAGFPQGISICGVLSNIFMMNFDETMTRYVTGRNGMYMRYCDDIIMVLSDRDAFRESCSLLFDQAKEYELTIEKDKTSCYFVQESRVVPCDSQGNAAEDSGNVKIQYLGFDFDGDEARLRQRTVNRYYRRMRRRVAFVFNQKDRPSKKRIVALYRDYSSKGLADVKPHFIAYARRAQRVCDRTPVKNGIWKDVRRHYLKIKREQQKYS